MTTPVSQSTSRRGFVDARLVQSRIVSESITSVPGRPNAKPQQVQLKTDVTSNIGVGIDDPTAPKEMVLDVQLNVELRLPDAEKSLVSFVVKHSSLFKVVAWTGFDDWSTIPQGALGPYLAMAYVAAIDQAEHSLLALGLKGITLPRSDRFEQYDDQPANGLTAVAKAEA